MRIWWRQTDNKNTWIWTMNPKTTATKQTPSMEMWANCYRQKTPPFQYALASFKMKIPLVFSICIATNWVHENRTEMRMRRVMQNDDVISVAEKCCQQILDSPPPPFVSCDGHSCVPLSAFRISYIQLI